MTPQALFPKMMRVNEENRKSREYARHSWVGVEKGGREKLVKMKQYVSWVSKNEGELIWGRRLRRGRIFRQNVRFWKNEVRGNCPGQGLAYERARASHDGAEWVLVRWWKPETVLPGGVTGSSPQIRRGGPGGRSPRGHGPGVPHHGCLHRAMWDAWSVIDEDAVYWDGKFGMKRNCADGNKGKVEYGDHEFQIYHLQFEKPLGYPGGCIQETNKGLEFWREVWFRTLYAHINSTEESGSVWMKSLLESIKRA